VWRLSRGKSGEEPDRLAELAALADGSLPEERRAELATEVAASPELSARLAEQQRAVTAVRGAAGSVQAPAGLHRRIEAPRKQLAERAAYRRPVLVGVGLAAAAAAVVLALTVPGLGGPSLAQAATLGALPADNPAPAQQAEEPKLLDLSVDGVPFPAYAAKFGWEATGARTDSLDGRRAVTVFYEKEGEQIAYTIVSGDPLDVPDDATRVTREGTDVYVTQISGHPVVTWQRGGRTCILTGSGVDPDTMVELAAWHGMGSVPF
jgi:hypothetical protein